VTGSAPKSLQTRPSSEPRALRAPLLPAQFTAGRENGHHRRPKGYAAWNPQRKTRMLLGQVEEILAEYRDQLPLTVRQIFYRLVAAYLYDKTEAAYQRLAEKLVRARRARLIPFHVIRDDGVVTVEHRYYGGVGDFDDETSRRARDYRRDRQQGQRVRVELWCEAAGMLHQLDRVAREYSVPVYSAGGFGSLGAKRDIAVRSLEFAYTTVVLHVGDFDPSGESIFEDIAEDAAAFVEADRHLATQRIEPVRVALTAEQVAEYRLPTAPVKESDSRSASWDGGTGTCQLEALAPDTLAEIVETVIVDRLDHDVYAAQLEREQAERAELLGLPPGGGSS
jgi:hypothetical protein